MWSLQGLGRGLSQLNIRATSVKQMENCENVGKSNNSTYPTLHSDSANSHGIHVCRFRIWWQMGFDYFHSLYPRLTASLSQHLTTRSLVHNSFNNYVEYKAVDFWVTHVWMQPINNEWVHTWAMSNKPFPTLHLFHHWAGPRVPLRLTKISWGLSSKCGQTQRQTSQPTNKYKNNFMANIIIKTRKAVVTAKSISDHRGAQRLGATGNS